MEPRQPAVAKPWGSYQILFAGPGFQVKRIEVNPGCRLSLQKHSKRSEKWTVVQGEGYAILEGRKIPVKTGSVVDVALEAPHRMANDKQGPLVFIEVQIGGYLGEDDIVRLEDDYNRK